MTSRECFENKWFYMKYIWKYLSGEKLLSRECVYIPSQLRWRGDNYWYALGFCCEALGVIF
jgi:hypothetical protein